MSLDPIPPDAADGCSSDPDTCIDAQLRRFNDRFRDDLTGPSSYGVRSYDPLLPSWTKADPTYRCAPDAATRSRGAESASLAEGRRLTPRHAMRRRTAAPWLAPTAGVTCAMSSARRAFPRRQIKGRFTTIRRFTPGEIATATKSWHALRVTRIDTEQRGRSHEQDFTLVFS